jgi:hypothetical protein
VKCRLSQPIAPLALRVSCCFPRWYIFHSLKAWIHSNASLPVSARSFILCSAKRVCGFSAEVSIMTRGPVLGPWLFALIGSLSHSALTCARLVLSGTSPLPASRS